MWRRLLAVLLVVVLVAGCGRQRGARGPGGRRGGLYAVMVPDGDAPCPARCSESYYADSGKGHEARYANCLSRCDDATVVDGLECASLDKPAKAACVTHFDGRETSADGPRGWPWLLGLGGAALLVLIVSGLKGAW